MRIYLKPFPDESLYSIICRYSLLNGIPSLNVLKERLIKKDKIYSKKETQVTVLLVRKFIELTCTPLDELINNHTLLNLYRPFSYVNCKQSSIRFINSAFVINSNGLSSRLCKECFLDDIRQYGVAYWHRSHSVPYINFCHIHKVRLKQRRISDLSKNGKFFMPDINMTSAYHDDEKYTGDIYEIRAAENCHELLQANSSLVSIEVLISRVIYDLEKNMLIVDFLDTINCIIKNKFGYKSSKINHEKCSVRLLEKLLLFLFAKKISSKEIIDFLNYFTDCIQNAYGTYENMFTLCRNFTKDNDSNKYLTHIREIRESYLKRKISTLYNVNNIFEV